ncbi:MAG: UDP-N-acetylmuramate dehydrogenase [Candidatus Paceibacterota bacterium]|jgi:UDP-N-acetylmuramate dehydrogenase
MLKILTDIKLSSFNTFKTGGNARFFCNVETESELIEAVSFAKENNLKFYVIGNGSNILIGEDDFLGLVIKLSIKGIEIESRDKDITILSSCAGENFDDLITFSIDNNLFGIENLWNIPGTVGASVVQNIGAYGVEIKDFIFSVEGIDINNFKKFNLKKENCDFEYRESVFKKNKNLIITKVFLKLNNSFFSNIEYISLKEYFSKQAVQIGKGELKVGDIIKAVEEIRRNKLPDWRVLGTAGSFFKNPIITEEKYTELLLKYPDLPKYNAKIGFVKIPLGFVIDKMCGLKNFRLGQVGLYEKQSLIIVNYGGAKFSEINSFANIIEEKVFEKIKIKIEREVENIF